MKNLKILPITMWIILLILIFPATVFSQKILEHYNVSNTAGPGIKDYNINEIMEDPNGNIWVATEYGGLNKWDGQKWEHYGWNSGLLSSTVNCFAMTSDGRIWVGTNNGIAILDGDQWSYMTYDEGLPGMEILDILVDSQDSVWILSYAFLSKYSHNSWREIAKVAYASLLYQDQRGRIWCNPNDIGALAYDGTKWDTFNTNNGLSNNNVNSFVDDKDQNLWIGTQRGLCKYKAGIWEYVFENDQITVLHRDSNDIIWVGLTDNTVRKFAIDTWTMVIPEFHAAKSLVNSKDGILYLGNRYEFAIWDGMELVKILPDIGLGSNEINDIEQDHEGNWWFATDREYSIYDGERWHNPGFAGFDRLEVYDIETCPDGRIWLATRFGVFILSTPYDGLNWIRYRKADGLAGERVFKIKFSINGGVWILTEDGASLFKDNQFTNFTVDNGLINKYVYDVWEDPSGDLWFATFGGISRLSSGNWTHYTSDQGLQSNQVYGLMQSSQGQLFAQNRWGIDSLDQNVWKPFTHEYGYVIIEDSKSNFWIATRTGLRKYDPYTKEFSKFSDADGLPHRSLSCLFYDQENEQLWVGTNYEGAVVLDISGSVKTSELFITDALQIYPNPALDMVYVRNPHLENQIVQITLYSLEGKIVKQFIKQITNGCGMFRVDDIPEGAYILYVQDDKNQYVQRLQVLK